MGFLAYRRNTTQNASCNNRLTPAGGRVQKIDDTVRIMYTDPSNSPSSTGMIPTTSSVTANNLRAKVILTL
jgi:hypothetical protein